MEQKADMRLSKLQPCSAGTRHWYLDGHDRTEPVMNEQPWFLPQRMESPW